MGGGKDKDMYYGDRLSGVSNGEGRTPASHRLSMVIPQNVAAMRDMCDKTSTTNYFTVLS